MSLTLSNATYRLSILTCGLGLLLASCGEPNVSYKEHAGIDTTGISSTGAILLRGQTIVIPPPALLSRVIEQQAIPFNRNILAAQTQSVRWVSSFQKALNLGVLGADLTYLVNYGQTPQIPTVFASIGALSQDLDLMQDVDSSIVLAIENGMEDPVQLLGLHSEFFRSMENYLKKNNRGDISAGILIGGWVESLYLIASLSDSTTTLDPLLAEQRYSAQGVLQLAKDIQDSTMVEILGDLEPLCEAFADLEHSYSFRDPMHDRREHITYLRSQSKVEFDTDQIEQLHALIRKTRQRIITP